MATQLVEAEMESSVRLEFLDCIHDVLKEIKEHLDGGGSERDWEIGLEQVVSLLNWKWREEGDKKAATSIKSYMDLPLTPQQKLFVIDADLSVYHNKSRVWEKNLNHWHKGESTENIGQ